MRSLSLPLAALACTALVASAATAKKKPTSDPMLGLPPITAPADNPTTPDKVKLGDRLFHDKRFSATGEVSCASCHDANKGFGDGLKTSEGIKKLTGTRNAPTVLNAALNELQFWDGRSPSLEDQALHPFVNPIEMGLPDHEPILKIVRTDKTYTKEFKKAFGVSGDKITMDHVTKAIAAFERTMVAGDSPFDRWFYGGDDKALTDQQQRGYVLFIGKARCVDCHQIEQTSASFTDGQFHNIGVGVNRIQNDIPMLAGAFIKANRTLEQVDQEVLSNPKSSELGRFAVDHAINQPAPLTRGFDGIGAFKTPTLRNVELTAPYMHDGSIATLEKVIEHYNNGGVTNEGDQVNDFLAGGIRPLNLTKEEQADVVAFLKALTSSSIPKPKFLTAAARAGATEGERTALTEEGASK
jgi:cytochrome c peroxidase